MADIDWGRAAIEAAASAASGLVGLVIGAWKFGRSGAQGEARLREELIEMIAQQDKRATARSDLLTEQFRETLDGIRRQMDELRYYTEKRFLAKEDFAEFRNEYRENNNRMNDKLDALINRH